MNRDQQKQLRIRMVRMVNRGKAIGDVAIHYSVTSATVYNALKRHSGPRVLGQNKRGNRMKKKLLDVEIFRDTNMGRCKRPDT